ncbi:putative RNA methyltransferase [Spinactinospora alkalitolerans]|nr:methyltransferase type 11 [Spinactinospora alkalitolerans]
MPGAVLRALACPHCGHGLAASGNGLGCDSGHRFDVAKEGYVSLLTGRGSAGTGDTAEMVRARRSFQDAGHFARLAGAVAETAACLAAGPGAGARTADGAPGGIVADVGAGTGYHLAAVLDRLPGATGVALDVSKFALRRAAKCHPRAGAAGCDAWQGLPLRSGAVSLLLNVFAPRDGAEFARVLRPDGALVVVTPTARHLGELVGPLGLVSVDPRKDERLERALGGLFEETGRDELDVDLALSRADAATAVEMGPSARHLSPQELRRGIAALPEPVAVTGSFSVSVHRPRPAPTRG